MRASASLSPDFVVAVPPYYYGAPQEVIYQHYQAIADAAECPLILYDIPSRTQNALALETAIRLMSHPNIAGMKDSSGDFIRFSRGVLGYNTPNFAWIQGEDYLDGASLLLGARGIVTGLGNVWIEPYINMRGAHRQGNAQAILQAQAQINALYEIINVTGKVIPPIKAGAMLLGRSTALMKTPGLTLSADEVAQVKGVLKKLGLL
ncbi:dihydrodipicolinate synthase [Candidatus Moduliflexus flocculans]|uniref:Dihydrodipicolinate synthase n=1 Tax=Candidatus Moduliflexus flocculans TaxID=1499966 RepID=A0A081BN55_9BACT|nr:dihydrodipicolinate synthase [Candidatus Moduliflexus flocculans]